MTAVADNWVLDITMHDDRTVMRAFCPIDDNGDVLVGLTLITDRPEGRVVGVFSEGGQEEVEAWCAAHPDVVAELCGGES